MAELISLGKRSVKVSMVDFNCENIELNERFQTVTN